MKVAHILAAAAVAGSMSLVSVSESQAQGLCPSDMGHLMSMGACHQRRGCLRSHLQYLSKSCLTRISFRNEQRFRMKMIRHRA